MKTKTYKGWVETEDGVPVPRFTGLGEKTFVLYADKETANAVFYEVTEATLTVEEPKRKEKK